MVISGKKEQPKIRRAPIVALLGHVDHGKTSILDAIRKTNVQEKEYGGITQHIGAYQIEYKSQKITFIDTPGHAAFTQMRARGGKTADIVILVVAANDSVMPQTVEAISHAKAANVPIIVAINKVDISGVNLDKVKQDLAQANVLVEDWGGDVVCVNVSAKNKKGLDDLLGAIIAVSEFLHLECDPDGELEAPIIESRLDRKRGVMVSCIVKSGTLRVGKQVVAGGLFAKIKSIMDDKGYMVKSANLGMPVEILGFKEVPSVGDLLLEKGSELAELSEERNKVEIIGKDAKKTIAVVLKADTQGTLQAVKGSLAELVSSSVGASFSLKFLHSATGDISDSDVMLAQSVNGLVMGFNVKIPSTIQDLARDSKVPVKSYNTIYDLVDDAKDFLEGTATEEEAKIKGRAKIVKTFKLASGDVIAGCEVIAGAVKEGCRISIYDKDPANVSEEDVPLYVGKVKKLKRQKEDITMAGKDTECGILFKPRFEDLKKDLWIEVM